MKRVLFVDDEVNVLNGLKRMLRSTARDWSMSFSQSGEEALDVMEKFPDFDVVVTDLNMEGISGADFLLKVREAYPKTVRFVLSGSTDAHLMLKVSNVAHQIMGKPCDPQKLYGAVSRAFALREQLNNDRLRAVLNKMGKLPALPVLYERIVQEMVLEDASVNRVGKLIEQDPALSAKVLQIVNSAYLGVRNPVSNLVQACSMLGLENLKNVVLMAEVFDLSVGKKLPPGFNLEALWRHCLLVGEGARNIAAQETDEKKVVDRSFTSGLLHEVGQLILATQLTEEFSKAIEYAKKNHVPLMDGEQAVLGITHAQVGSYLLELWGLPDPVVEAIAFHIYPSACPVEDYSMVASGYETETDPDFSPLTALHVSNYFAEEKDALGYIRTDADTNYLEQLGYVEKMDPWWDCCNPQQVG
jgi:HD-like signal output (HDOD) protein